jgi:HEPN domain-containing protein
MGRILERFALTKIVEKTKYRNYLKKAIENLEVANHALDKSKYNAAVNNAIHCAINAIHCAINAIDSLAVYYIGKRHDGKHEDAIGITKEALTEEEYIQISKQYTGLMELKNQAEYQPDLMGKDDAKDAVKRASRILSKVRERLPNE